MARSAATTNAVILSGATGVSRPERNRKISNSCLSSIVKHRIQARRFKKTHAIGPPTAGSPPLWSWNPAALRCQDDSIGGHGAFAPTHLTAEVSNHIPILLIFALIGFTPVFWMKNPAAPPSPGRQRSPHKNESSHEVITARACRKCACRRRGTNGLVSSFPK